MKTYNQCTKISRGGVAKLTAVAALFLGLGLSQNVMSAQASGSIQLISASPNLVEGQIFNVTVNLVNTSTEDDQNGGGGIPAVFKINGQIDVTLACTSSTCATGIPDTLELVECISPANAGITCTSVGNNGVRIDNTTTKVDLLYLNPKAIVTMRLRAKTPYAGGTPPNIGRFFQRGDTGSNDLVATSPIEGVDVTGAAGGSRNFDFPPVCDAQLDKQISCDGGTTWADAGTDGAPLFDDGVASPCSATDPTLIKVRYIVKNPSSTLSIDGCSLTESNPDFGTPGQVSPIGPGGVVTIPGTLTPACINAEDGEPNTAAVSCNICQGVQVATGQEFGDSDQANLICEPIVELKVDRNVDCGPAGANDTGGTSDATLTKFNNDGTNGCKAFDGDNVCWEYVAKNESTRPLFDCTFVDTSAIVGGNGAPYVVGNLAPSAQASVDCKTAGLARLGRVCSQDLENSENPDLGNLGLTCCTVDVDGISNCQEPNRVIRYDISTVECLTPNVNLTKECVDTNQDGRSDKVVLTTENTGEVDLTTCALTDNLAGVGPITVVPDTINNLAPRGSVISEGTIGVQLTADALNTATVQCTAADGTTYERTATDTCTGVPEQNECLTRTPGFWGTHPAITDDYLNLEVCGTTIDNVLANSTTSAIEAMCSVGQDGKILGSQKTQLIRQCTAAALNIKASLTLGGDCDNAQGAAGIDATYAACCGGESICTGGSVQGYNINRCISSLDYFNNLPNDTLNFPGKTGPANSSVCRDSKNNGVVVSPTP